MHFKEDDITLSVLTTYTHKLEKVLEVMDIFSNCGDNITSVCLCPKSARCTPLMHAIFGISTIHHEGKKNVS